MALDTFTLQHTIHAPALFDLRHKAWEAIAYGSRYKYNPRRWRVTRSPRITMCSAVEMGEALSSAPVDRAKWNRQALADKIISGVRHETPRAIHPTTIRTAAGVNTNEGKTFLRLYAEIDHVLNARLKREQEYIREVIASYIGCAAVDICLSNPYATLAMIPSAETEQDEINTITDAAEKLGICRVPVTISPLRLAKTGRGESNFIEWQTLAMQEKNPIRSQQMYAYAANLGLVAMGRLPEK